MNIIQGSTLTFMADVTGKENSIRKRTGDKRACTKWKFDKRYDHYAYRDRKASDMDTACSIGLMNKKFRIRMKKEIP
jgi:hypothetical protein